MNPTEVDGFNRGRWVQLRSMGSTEVDGLTKLDGFN